MIFIKYTDVLIMCFPYNIKTAAQSRTIRWICQERKYIPDVTAMFLQYLWRPTSHRMQTGKLKTKAGERSLKGLYLAGCYKA